MMDREESQYKNVEILEEEVYATYEIANHKLGESNLTALQMTTKIAPAYDGRTSWFAYEEAIADWIDVCTVDPEARGPSLRNRLQGEAAVYKPLLDREILRDPVQGVRYFTEEMRKHFVKGAQSVFLWRFLIYMRVTRGGMDFLKWIARFQVLRKRLKDAWMDTETDVPMEGPEYQTAIAQRNQELVAAQMMPIPPDDWDAFQNYVQIFVI